MDENAQAPQEQAGADQGQTAELPLTMFGGQEPKEGDVFEFKVVAINADSGTVTVAYNTGDAGDDAGGSDGMAEEFSKDRMAKQKY